MSKERIDVLLERHGLIAVSPRSNGGPWAITPKVNERKSFHALAGSEILGHFDAKNAKMLAFLEGIDAQSFVVDASVSAIGNMSSNLTEFAFRSEMQHFEKFCGQVFANNASHCSNILVARALSWEALDRPENWTDMAIFHAEEFVSSTFGKCQEWGFEWKLIHQPTTVVTRYRGKITAQTMPTIFASCVCNSQSFIMVVEPIQYSYCSECDNVIITEPRHRHFTGDDTPVTVIDGKYRCGRC